MTLASCLSVLDITLTDGASACNRPPVAQPAAPGRAFDLASHGARGALLGSAAQAGGTARTGPLG